MSGCVLHVWQDPRPMVRIITCWCLARYTQWVLVPPQGEGGSQQGPVSPEAEVRELLSLLKSAHT